LKLE